ncbi:MAG TPA: bifunctional tRNA (5-methylaminomethyl-2-thiouridine)(34)-methyltransferase MnmD/FAD-dependent 5-carboxymethylaminomethyl-2-thiouridine(34) oxidoreductase MnmC [Usitatibacter sp.]|nr:bifunctional tRNA (5-methylaminomethyl-2-thiouridine)(34)-methyltransferase MnmD/FAD-dependent 5-carboxymethylaminomethyl-2-thiouridine(34) oxidoreductase MnmC [Usitatibacter sp.]
MAGHSVTLPAARLARDASGTPYSAEYQDVYHSAHGGLEQARHVFLEGNGLPERWRSRASFTIVETGFGIGLNFLATWDAWRADAARSRRLHFVSTENRPFAPEALREALAPFGAVQPLAGALAAAWPPAIAGFHRLHFDAGRVILTLLLGDAAQLLPQLVGRADALYLDGFAPARNPELWTPEVVRELARLARPGATLATWTVAGGVRTALADAGFRVEKRPGFAAKREMLHGVREGAAAREAPRRERRAVVVGGSLAGTLAAERLASRDWEVELLEARSEGVPPAVGLVRPIANMRDALNARLSRGAFLYALQHFRTLEGDGLALAWRRCGVLQLAEDAEEAARFEAVVRSQGYPPEFLDFVDAARARELAGREVRGPGWWFPSGAAIAPASFGAASAARSGERVRRRPGVRVERLEREGDAWRAFDAGDRVLAEAPVVILANAVDAARLLPEARLRLARVRGQLTYLPAAPARALDIVVSGTGYVAPLFDGGHAVGATYRHGDEDAGVRAADHVENLARADAMLPGFAAGVAAGALEGWTGFRTTVPDRLPVAGATAVDGIHTLTGLGSRGLLWGPLAAEAIASALEDEPLPLARDHAGAISPLRFLS